MHCILPKWVRVKDVNLVKGKVTHTSRPVVLKVYDPIIRIFLNNWNQCFFLICFFFVFYLLAEKKKEIQKCATLALMQHAI